MGAEESFDRVRGAVWGVTGFVARKTTVITTLPIVGSTSTQIVETVHTPEGWLIFLQAITPEGTYRLVLPSKVVEALHNQHEAIAGRLRRDRAQRGAETRRERKVLPFPLGLVKDIPSGESQP